MTTTSFATFYEVISDIVIHKEEQYVRIDFEKGINQKKEKEYWENKKYQTRTASLGTLIVFKGDKTLARFGKRRVVINDADLQNFLSNYR